MELRDVEAFLKKHQVGEGTYGYVALFVVCFLGWNIEASLSPGSLGVYTWERIKLRGK